MYRRSRRTERGRDEVATGPQPFVNAWLPVRRTAAHDVAPRVEQHEVQRRPAVRAQAEEQRAATGHVEAKRSTSSTPRRRGLPRPARSWRRTPGRAVVRDRRRGLQVVALLAATPPAAQTTAYASTAPARGVNSPSPAADLATGPWLRPRPARIRTRACTRRPRARARRDSAPRRRASTTPAGAPDPVQVPLTRPPAAARRAGPSGLGGATRSRKSVGAEPAALSDADQVARARARVNATAARPLRRRVSHVERRLLRPLAGEDVQDRVQVAAAASWRRSAASCARRTGTRPSPRCRRTPRPRRPAHGRRGSCRRRAAPSPSAASRRRGRRWRDR